MDDHLGIRGGLKDGAVCLQLIPQDTGIDQVAIMGNRNRTMGVFNDKGLGVLEMALSCGGIAVVADGTGPFQALDHLLFEDIGHKTHLAMGDQDLAIRGDNAGGFLAAVLKGIEAKVNHVGCLGVAIDPHDSTLFVKFIQHHRY